ncbi:Lacal_2735 family protein [Maribellus sediminis]|uniref:Lacal_2735 family protein n=1 Tax=Maribellus sediminis TaxID=2696285 RepID=UPI0023F7D373|nr:Lacal_2735 family protein [Maribellus sediminis]
MFGFLKKDPMKALIRQHDKLMEEAFRLSRINRRMADQKYAEAELVQQKMDALRTVK